MYGISLLNALTASDRSVTVQIAHGFGIDSTAADDVTSISGGFLPMSNVDQLTDANYIMTSGLATFEGDGIPTASSARMLVPPLQSVVYPPQAGVWSDVISDADGLMDWTVTIELSKAHSSAFSVHTSEVHITKGRIQYLKDGASVRDVTIESTSSVFQDPVITEYDTIILTVMSVTEPHHHVRIAEIEFGASVTLSNDAIGETVTLIMEYDPTQMSTPLWELDFDILNVEGQYDQDNPDTLLTDIPPWTPLVVSFSIIVDGVRTTVPVGTYYITDRVGQDTLLRVTAQDARAILSSTLRPITLSTSQSLGDLYEALLTELQIPYVIDDGVYDVYPDADATLDAQEWTLLQQAGFIEQYHGVHLTPGRDGYLHVTVGPPGTQVPALGAELLLEFPVPSMSTTYNIISVNYGPSESMQTYTLDLRTTPSEVRSVLTVTNPLVMDLTNAQRIAQALVPAVSGALYEATAVADATLDPRDVVPIAGRWSMDAPESYRVKKVEYTFDGSFSMKVTGARI